MGFKVRLQKENFKFSGTHFTIFSSHQAERMHGHNYIVRVEIEVSALDPKLGLAFDFNEVKPVIKKACDDLDEYVLIPIRSPYIQIQKDQERLHVSFQKKTYSFPLEDVRELPLVNITSEELAKYLAEQIRSSLKSIPSIAGLTVEVEETRGQSVAYSF